MTKAEIQFREQSMRVLENVEAKLHWAQKDVEIVKKIREWLNAPAGLATRRAFVRGAAVPNELESDASLNDAVEFALFVESIVE